MGKQLRVLILEDRAADAELMVYALKQAGFEVAWQRVDSEADFREQLKNRYDIILADYALPQFDALRALALLQESEQDIPFIVISGTIGEETAVATMRAGAHDYLMKDNLARLAPAVRREIAEAAERHQRREAEAALQRYAARLNILHELDRAILAAQSPQSVAQATLHLIRKLIPCHHAVIALVENNFTHIKTIAQYPQNKSHFLQSLITQPSPAFINNLQWGHLHIINDLTTQETPSPLDQQLLSAGYHAYALVPLIAQDGLIGLLHLAAKQPNCYKQEELEILQEVANSVAIALQQTRLYEAEKAARKTAETLHAANLALSQTLELGTLLEILLDYLAQLIPYDSANVMLRENLHQVAVHALRGYERWTNPENTRQLHFDAHTSPIIKRILEKQESILIPDTRQHPDWQRVPGAEHVMSWLGVPLVAGGEVLGLYSVDKVEPGFFTPKHLQLANALAPHAAVAIQNARLFSQVRAGQARLQTLSRRLVEIQEAERRSIARELHDEVGQILTGLNLLLEMSTRLPTEAARLNLQEAQSLVHDLMSRVREMSLDLRPTMLDDLGLFPALLWHFERYQSQTQIEVHFFQRGVAERRFAPEVETAAYRIIQEALTNVARYAHVTEVTVRLWAQTDTLTIQVEDEGAGFVPEQVLATNTSSGLTSIQERATLLGGQVEIISAPGQGTRITAELPLIPTIHSKEETS